MKKILVIILLVLGLGANSQITRSTDLVKADKDISMLGGSVHSIWYGDNVILKFKDLQFTTTDVYWKYSLTKSELNDVYTEIERVFTLSEYPKGTSFDFANAKGEKITVRFDKSMGYKTVNFFNKVSVSPTVGNPDGIIIQISAVFTKAQIDKLFDNKK